MAELTRDAVVSARTCQMLSFLGACHPPRRAKGHTHISKTTSSSIVGAIFFCFSLTTSYHHHTSVQSASASRAFALVITLLQDRILVGLAVELSHTQNTFKSLRTLVSKTRCSKWRVPLLQDRPTRRTLPLELPQTAALQNM